MTATEEIIIHTRNLVRTVTMCEETEEDISFCLFHMQVQEICIERRRLDGSGTRTENLTCFLMIWLSIRMRKALHAPLPNPLP